MNPNLTSGNVMDTAASLVNDTAKSHYNYTIQLPYLNIALRELEENFQLNNLPVTDEYSTEIIVPAETREITYPPTTPLVDVPYLPTDLKIPRELWERTHGVGSYTPMTPTNVLQQLDSNINLNQLIYYNWTGRSIRLLPGNVITDIKILYIRGLFVPLTNVTGTDPIAVTSAESYLGFKTAALLAKFVEENDARATELNGWAELALDKVEGINIKSKQAIMTRRRPFRAGYKSF